MGASHEFEIVGTTPKNAPYLRVGNPESGEMVAWADGPDLYRLAQRIASAYGASLAKRKPKGKAQR